MKKEVKEAWEAYKGVQEKAALREAELLDEISELGLPYLFFLDWCLEKAKSVDRQAMVTRLTTLEMMQQTTELEIQTLRKENTELVAKMATIDIETAQWKEEEIILREELQEAKLNSNQNLDGLREELRVAQVFF